MAFLAIPLILIVLVALMVRIRNLRKNAKANIVSFTNQNGDSKASAKNKESKFGKWMSEKTNKNKRNGFTRLNQDSDNEETVHLNKQLSSNSNENDSDSDNDEVQITLPTLSKA
jgi:lipopolysaccharide export LptBFGC system permease protein LptF